MAALVPHLRAYARALAHGVHLADDLVQDTILNALRARDRFTQSTSLEAWLLTILRTAA